ncbi:hypothetical protein ABI59_23280 [Acidobacteria bacterium Mor1]|nr:hypothetical protein ABI59_23280 [Acidobacteria bacterium Mor1]
MRAPNRNASRLLPVAAAVLLAATLPAWAQVQGEVFEDRNANGIRDAGEPALEGVTIELLGAPDAGGSVDTSLTTAADGAYSFAPGNGCYVLRVQDPPGWRQAGPRFDGVALGTPGYQAPVGIPRVSTLDNAIDHLRAGSLRYVAMGDSIAYNWNSCLDTSAFWYSNQFRSRLACTAPGATVTLGSDGEAAVKGEHTDDLLVDQTNDWNNIFRILDQQPQLVTLSMIGNDLLGVDAGNNPTQPETNRAVEEVLDAYANLQEVISVMLTEVPGIDIQLNSLYDNEAYDCGSTAVTDFHREWLPIIDHVLREMAWGQARRVAINEVAAEFAREDLLGGCTGFENRICNDFFGTDGIHPTEAGYEIILEKLWEAAGGVNLGSRDSLNRTSIDQDYGYLRRVRRLLPSNSQTLGGGGVTSPEAAFNDDDGGASASITLGSGAEEVRFGGFPDWFDEVQIVRAVAGVRFNTTGTVGDDYYRMEASLGGQFRPDAGHAYSTTDWSYYTPLVGAGGPNKPDSNADYPNAQLMVVPNAASPREVSSTLIKNPEIQGNDYVWPTVTHEELAATQVRVLSAPVANTPGNDNYQVELDAAWIDLYGWEKPRPDEVQGLRVDFRADGAMLVSFDPLAGADRYNLYFGRVDALGAYDHGAGAPAGPYCASPTQDAGGGRLEIVVLPGDQPLESSYVVVTGHVDDVESPAGFASDGTEIDRSRSDCR